MEAIILTAVLSFTAATISPNATGYQVGAVEPMPSMEMCKAAGQQFLDTYRRGNIKKADPDRGHIVCTLYRDGKEASSVVVYTQD